MIFVPSELREYAKIEKEMSVEFHKTISEEIQKKMRNDDQELSVKQIFVISGEPRTGKTTLGQFASMSHIADMLDTDHYDETEVILGTETCVREFLKNSKKHALFIIVGKYRKYTKNIVERIKPFAHESVFITVCTAGQA